MAEDIVGILLAAGRGVRFDPSGHVHKLLAALPGGTVPLAVAAASARSLRASVGRVIAVVPDEDSTQQQELRALLLAEGCSLLRCTATPQEAGTGRSIACGVQASADASGWIVALADMPYLRAETIGRVRAALSAGAVTAAPVYRGRRGHPVGFGPSCGPALQALRGDSGARALLETYPPQTIAVDDPGILQDVDHPSDLRAAGTDVPPDGAFP